MIPFAVMDDYLTNQRLICRGAHGMHVLSLVRFHFVTGRLNSFAHTCFAYSVVHLLLHS